jgi:large subunit ribosomal protein L18
MKTIQKRRRIENKTDYKSRVSLLRSQKLRIVFRKSNKYVLGQVIKSEEAKDKVICSANSKELLKHGWKNQNSVKNLAASYLTGILLGKKINDKKIKNDFILDIGILRNHPQGKIYAFARGLKDAKINIPVNEKVFPKDNRLYLKLEKQEVEKIKKSIEK